MVDKSFAVLNAFSMAGSENEERQSGMTLRRCKRMFNRQMSVDVVESSVQYSISTTQVKSVKVQVERLTILGSPGETDSDRGLGWSYFGTLLFEPQTALCLNIAPRASVYAQIDRLLIDVLQALALLMPRTILKTSIHQFSLSR